ncbi:MAG: hypothetical protein AB8G18_08805 [Gammaproteobacteria bacterium]
MFRTVIGLALVLSIAAVSADSDTDAVANSTLNSEMGDASDRVRADFVELISSVSDLTVADNTLLPGESYKRHLGLGFTHGMANINLQKTGRMPGQTLTNPPLADFVFGNGNTSPRQDNCHGNGHPKTISNAGNQTNTGNGFGYTDCGDPSPSD